MDIFFWNDLDGGTTFLKKFWFKTTQILVFFLNQWDFQCEMTSKAIESNGISSISTSASTVESDGKEASAEL